MPEKRTKNQIPTSFQEDTRTKIQVPNKLKTSNQKRELLKFESHSQQFD
jgi:hypothetical protein